MARALTAAQVIAFVAPQLDSVDEAVVEEAILEAVAFTNEDAWGSEERYNVALKYLALHLLTRALQAQAGAASTTPTVGGALSLGMVKWIQADNHQIGYSTPSGVSQSAFDTTDAWLATTEWGQRYAFLSRRNFADRII